MYPVRNPRARPPGRTTLRLSGLALAAWAGLSLPACNRTAHPGPSVPPAAVQQDQARARLPYAEVALTPSEGGPRVVVRVELARTLAEQEHGLMFRRDLAEGAGMLFLFDHPDMRSFWMKNTYVPLDMLFLDADRRVVGIEADTVPQDETPRGPGVPAQYVLEVPAGYCRRHHIGLGSQAEFLHVDDRAD